MAVTEEGKKRFEKVVYRKNAVAEPSTTKVKQLPLGLKRDTESLFDSSKRPPERKKARTIPQNILDYLPKAPRP